MGNQKVMKIDNLVFSIFKRILLFILLLMTTIGFADSKQGVTKMIIQSPAFENNGFIPSKYTCDGENISPELSWHDAPNNTKSFVLLVDDPDAPHGTWDHWILFNIPGNKNLLEENIKTLPIDARIGKNSWGNKDYGGACPPSGVHRYFFKLYALDTMLNLKDGASKFEIENAMKKHVISESELIGKYKRK